MRPAFHGRSLWRCCGNGWECPRTVYDATCIAIVPTGLCTPARRKAATCRRARNARRCGLRRLIQAMPQIRLTAVIGALRQAYTWDGGVAERWPTGACMARFLSGFIPLPHPSPLNRLC